VGGRRSWVMLAYRMPREPSTPRIAVWRRLRQLGVAQPVDGLVLLPDEPHTREGLDWVAERVLAAGGHATQWSAVHASAAEENATVQAMNAAVTVEYAALTRQATAAAAGTSTDVPLALSTPEGTETVEGVEDVEDVEDVGQQRESLALPRVAARLGRALAQIQARDYFAAPGRAGAERAVLALAALAKATKAPKEPAR